MYISLRHSAEFFEYLSLKVHEYSHEIDCCLERCGMDTKIRMYVPVSEPFSAHVVIVVRSQQVLPYTQDFGVFCLFHKRFEQPYFFKAAPLHVVP